MRAASRSRSLRAPSLGGVRAPSTSDDAVIEGGFDLRLLPRLWRLVKPQRHLFISALLLYLPLTAAALVQPWLMGQAVDRALLAQRPRTLLFIVGGMGLALLVQSLCQFAQLMAMQVMGQRIIRQLRHDILAHLQRLDAAFYDRSPVGRLLTRATNDMEAISDLFSSGAVTIVGDVITLTGIVVVLFLWSPELAVAAMVSVPLVLVVTGLIRDPARRAFRVIRAQTAHLNTYLAEHLGGMAVVQAAVRERPVWERFQGLSRDFLITNNRANLLDATLYAGVEAIAAMVTATLLWYGAVGVEAGVLSLGVVIGFIEYLRRFFAPLRDLSSKFTMVQSAMTAAERAFGLLDERSTVIEVDDSRPVPALARGVRFDQVSFAYRDDTPVLRDLSFEVRRGERVALVGRTGSGKTTVARLLARHYDVSDGRILLDDQDIRELRLAELRERFALVLQDVFLFRGSLRDNLAFGRDSIDDSEIEAAVAAAGAEELIARRGGLSASVAERGLNLSTGERQVVALLRTLLSAPDILILDEATASVDSATEQALQRAIEVAVMERTSIIIAHRLSTIRCCDRILVLHDGRLVEAGSHDELMQVGTVYPMLYRLQYERAGERVESHRGESD